MTNIWHGADPTGAIDASAYELGSVIEALTAVTLNGIRVWSPANAVTRTNRRGHVWAMDGTLLATITMTDTLPSGWSTHLLDTPLPLTAGQFAVISYETSGNYGVIAGAFATSTYVSADAAACFPLSKAVANFGTSHGNGRFNTIPGSAPNQSTSAWYGVDADYTVPGAGTAPTLAIALTVSGLGVTAVLTATDPDGLAGATYAVDWGDGNTSTGSGTSYSHTYAVGGMKSILASVTDSTGLKGYRAAAVELISPGSGLADSILDRLTSHAMSTGLFERVNTHEPTNAPGNGLTCALWADRIGPVRSSGLNSTSARIIFNVRIYSNMNAEPQDAIDPNVIKAVDTLFTAYSGDFTLGVDDVRHIDLLGVYGIPLEARAGYLKQDGSEYRVVTISVPVIVNDVWEQVS